MTDSLPEKIGKFSIIRSLGKGGMGEVFLAQDPSCNRLIALKCIKKELAQKEVIKRRFLKEATITATLTHPSIVPIYSIHDEGEALYYIMPYLEGVTLKEMIREGKTSVDHFLRIFLNICQAVAYAHSKGYIHRDLKPENIIVGTFGQVYILDWGLVKQLDESEEEFEGEVDERKNSLTRPGKLLGTISYMAPERLQKHPSTPEMDIYALGVILYQLLTLHLPFYRRSLKEFKERVGKERFIEPSERNPYRDVPLELSLIVKKALHPDPSERYSTLATLTADVEAYVEGKSKWLFATTLTLSQKKDWEFQEYLMIPKSEQRTEWITASLSKESFFGNIQMMTTVKIAKGGKGIGFLLKVPKARERKSPLEGYSIWISAKKKEATKLFFLGTEVIRTDGFHLEEERLYEIRVEITGHYLHLFINNQLVFSYINYIPLFGGLIGVVTKDSGFELSPLEISVGSLNLKLSCLAVPEAFLAHKDYEKALHEYERIASLFWGRKEAREAQFLSGITLLEWAKEDKLHDFVKLQLAEEAFEKLHNTSGAPLEYLGKALLYEHSKELIEEVKTLALALRRYKNHPLISVIKERALFRLHNNIHKDRLTTFYFLHLILSSYDMNEPLNEETEHLFNTIENQLEAPLFLKKEEMSKREYLLLLLSLFLENSSALLEQKEEEHSSSFNEQKKIVLSLLNIGNSPLSIIQQALDNQDFATFYQNIETLNTPHLQHLFKIEAALLQKDLSLLTTLFSSYRGKVEEERFSNYLHYLYGCYLSLKGEEINNYFASLVDAAYPPLSQLPAHYLFGKGLNRSLWQERATPYEKTVLTRTLLLYPSHE